MEVKELTKQKKTKEIRRRNTEIKRGRNEERRRETREDPKGIIIVGQDS